MPKCGNDSLRIFGFIGGVWGGEIIRNDSEKVVEVVVACSVGGVVFEL